MKQAVVRALVDRERLRLIRHVRSLIRETAEMDAEDIVHDVLMNMLERPGSAAPLADVTSYVYRSVKNRVIDLVRTRKSAVPLQGAGDDERPELIDFLADKSPSALDRLQSEEGKRALFAALNKLSDIERRVVIATEFEDISFRELSVSLRMPQNTLLSHKARAMTKLKKYLVNSK